MKYYAAIRTTQPNLEACSLQEQHNICNGNGNQWKPSDRTSSNSSR
jgi:hypothetical protein